VIAAEISLADPTANCAIHALQAEEFVAWEVGAIATPVLLGMPAQIVPRSCTDKIVLLYHGL
jgi:hypothetical protein